MPACKIFAQEYIKRLSTFLISWFASMVVWILWRVFRQCPTRSMFHLSHELAMKLLSRYHRKFVNASSFTDCKSLLQNSFNFVSDRRLPYNFKQMAAAWQKTLQNRIGSNYRVNLEVNHQIESDIFVYAYCTVNTAHLVGKLLAISLSKMQIFRPEQPRIKWINFISMAIITTW